MSRKSFIIHIDSLDILDDLTLEQRGELFTAIKSYQIGDEIDLSPIVKIAFSPFKNQFIRDGVKYKETCKRRAIAGSKGGKQKVANASNCKQKVAKVADSKSKSKNKNDSKSDSKRKVFKPPSLNDLVCYIGANQYTVNAKSWLSHYESNGWMVGRNKMKDWKAAVRTWNNRSKENETNNRTRKLTAVERVEAAGREQEAAVIDVTPHTEALGEDGTDIWPQVD